MGTQYASAADLVTYGLPATALGILTLAQQNGALEQASRKLDALFAGRFGQPGVPFLAWDTTVTEACAKVAAFDLLCLRGFNPASAADVNIKDRHDEAMKWAEKVMKQQAHPNVTPAIAPLPTYAQPTVISSSVADLNTGASSLNRGW